MTIKAIQTRYKGYHFRSRLEARWAVFFDALGLEWEYEPEGFDLDGVWYLPDFYLSAQKVWVEIKGAEASQEEIGKCMLLASHVIGDEEASDAFMTGDGSILNRYVDFAVKELGSDPLSAMLDAAKHARDRGAVYCLEGLFNKAWLCTSGHAIQCMPEKIFVKMFADEMALQGDCWSMEKKDFEERAKGTYRIVGNALTKARSARFEHGQSGATL